MKSAKKRVSIISRESNEKTLDILMLEAELKRRGIRVTTLCRLLTKERSLKALGYAGHMLRQEAAILGSDVVILDTYCIPASMLPHRRGTEVVQIWHAIGAVKKFGWQTVGKEGGSSLKTARLMRMHHGYDHVACASDITAKHFCEAFRTSPDKIVKYGLPRLDYVKSVSKGDRRDDMRRRIFSKYPELCGTGRTLVLYAPTFRRGKAVDAEGLINALDPEKYDVVVKLHPLYREPAEPAETAGQGGTQAAGSRSSEDSSSEGGRGASKDSTSEDGRCVIYDEEFSSYDWLAAADIVISDYSSFLIEASPADKPLYVYAYDLEEYAANTGLNMDFAAEPIAPYVFASARELAAALDDEYDYEALRAFRDRYIDIDTENCTAALADYIESLL